MKWTPGCHDHLKLFCDSRIRILEQETRALNAGANVLLWVPRMLHRGSRVEKGAYF